MQLTLKHTYLIIYLLLLTSTYSVVAQSQNQSTSHADVTAQVVIPYSAEKTAPMHFGQIYPGREGGTISLSPENALSLSGNIARSTEQPHSANFYVGGGSHTAFYCALPDTTLLVNTANNKTLCITQWEHEPYFNQVSLLQNGFRKLRLGATLEVGSIYDNPAGIYTGHYRIRFDFY